MTESMTGRWPDLLQLELGFTLHPVFMCHWPSHTPVQTLCWTAVAGMVCNDYSVRKLLYMIADKQYNKTECDVTSFF